MNRSLVQTLILPTLLFSLTSWAGERVNESMEASASDFIDIEHMNGVAKITGWSKDEVQVKGELDDDAEEFVFERRGNEIRIEVEMPSNKRNWNRNSGDDLVIYVPEGSAVQYSSINADVEIENLKNGVRTDTVNGGIEADSISGRIRLESVNGHIESSKLQGDIKIETVNGDISDEDSQGSELWYDSVNGDIRAKSANKEIFVETVNGGVDLSLEEIEKLQVSTVNGKVEASFELIDGGEVDASSVGGKIELKVNENVSARFDLEGHAGGRIINRLTNDKEQRAKYGPRRWLEFTAGKGEGKVSVSTVSGKIVVEKR